MIRLNVNGHDHEVDAEPDTPLLYVLRDELGLNGAKFGCGLGQCGACTVMVDGQAVFSCLTPLAALPGRNVRTIEGLGMNAVQHAFIEEQAAQCGYCIAGMVMRAQALLEHNPHPSEQRNSFHHVGEPLPLRHAYAHSGRGAPRRRHDGSGPGGEVMNAVLSRRTLLAASGGPGRGVFAARAGAAAAWKPEGRRRCWTRGSASRRMGG